MSDWQDRCREDPAWQEAFARHMNPGGENYTEALMNDLRAIEDLRIIEHKYFQRYDPRARNA